MRPLKDDGNWTACTDGVAPALPRLLLVAMGALPGLWAGGAASMYRSLPTQVRVNGQQATHPTRHPDSARDSGPHGERHAQGKMQRKRSVVSPAFSPEAAGSVFLIESSHSMTRVRRSARVEPALVAAPQPLDPHLQIYSQPLPTESYDINTPPTMASESKSTGLKVRCRAGASWLGSWLGSGSE